MIQDGPRDSVSSKCQPVKRLNLLLAHLTVKNYLAALLLLMKLNLEWSGVLVVVAVADMATIVAEEMVEIEGLAGNIRVVYIIPEVFVINPRLFSSTRWTT